VKGISNALIRTEATMVLKLLTAMRPYTFHVMGYGFVFHYDGILEQDNASMGEIINFNDIKSVICEHGK
jgi:hypothetical protein